MTMMNKKNVKRTKRMAFLMLLFSGLFVIQACQHVDEEPDLNQGYDSNFRMPDSEPMTAEDSAFVAAQQEEYETNAK